MEDLLKEKKRRLYLHLLAGFFLFMLLFTILSRMIDTYSTAKVNAEFVGRKPVSKSVEGDGIIAAKEMLPVSLIKGARIREVVSGPGTAVNEGDILLNYNVNSLLEIQSELVKGIKKLENQNAQERLGAESYTGTTKEELAAQDLAVAEQGYAEQAETYQQAEQQHTENLADLKEYYEKRDKLSREELIDQSRLDYYDSRDSVSVLRGERDAELKGIRRQIDDTRNKIDDLTDQGGDPEEIDDLEENLAQYEEDLEDASRRWERRIEFAEEKSDEKEGIFDRAGKDMNSARLALKESYDTAVKQEDKTLEAARQELVSSGHSVEKARLFLGNARKEDQAEASRNQKSKQLAELRCGVNALDMEALKKELKQVEQLINAGGVITAPYKSTVALSELEPEKELSGNERFLLTSGELEFKGTFDREENGGSILSGDEMTVKLEGEQVGFPVTVEQVDMVSSEEKITVTGTIPQGTAALGAKASFECSKQSEIYPTVIPLKALRKDTQGYYCLVLTTYKTILGEEFRAARVDVKLIYSGDTAAAVEGSFTDSEKIIVGSDRVINAGDRVRPVENVEGGY